MRPVRVALIGNLCDNALIFGRLLKAGQLSVTIYLSREELESSSDPEVQGKAGMDVEKRIVYLCQNNPAIVIWDHRPAFAWLNQSGTVGRLIFKALGAARLLSGLRRHDVIFSFAMYHIVALLSGRPYIAFSTGADLHDIAVERSLKGWLMRVAFRRACSVRGSYDPTSRAHAVKLRLGGIEPFLIPWPVPAVPVEPLRDTGPIDVFMPSRQDWCDPGRAHIAKRNDLFIRAWARRVREGWESRLTVVEHGEDVEATRQLVRDLGVEEKVDFVPRLAQNQLQKRIEEADLVADQFDQGTPGALSLQTLATGRALCMYWDEYSSAFAFSCVPPLINGNSEKVLYEGLVRYASRANLQQLGCRGHSWIKREYCPERLRQQLYLSIALATGIPLEVQSGAARHLSEGEQACQCNADSTSIPQSAT